MPGSYSITSTDIVNRLGNERAIQVSNDAGTGTVDVTMVDAQIVAAEREFHRYAAVYHATPLRKSDGTTVPEGIKELLIDSAAWFLMTRRAEFLIDEREGKFWERRRKEITDYYEAISRVLNPLPVPGAVVATTPIAPRGGEPTVRSDTPLFKDLGSLMR